VIPASDVRTFYRCALGFAQRARRVVLARRGRFRKSLKADSSWVTDVDRAVERELRSSILRRFPDHGIVGEEFGRHRPEAEFQWILDPLDGTLSFTHGIPFYGTLLGLHHRGRPLVGVIDHPALGLRYSAGLGLGSFKDGARLRVRDLEPGDRVSGEVLCMGDRARFAACGAAPGFDAVMRAHPAVRTYADCIGHTLAAEGAVGAMADYGIKLWDLAATQVLVEEAGGLYLRTYERRSGGETVYGAVFGKPAVVRWLSRFFT